MTHYLDHAATTPCVPQVLEAWMRTARDLAAHPGNPASLHGGGRRARRLLEDARAQVAQALGAQRPEVVFTSGATEADALAVVGGARGVRSREPHRRQVLLGGADHDAVLEQAEVLSRDGMEVRILELDRDGRIQVEMLRSSHALALVSVGMVSSELGTLQDVGDILRSARTHHPGALVHTDAAQAIPVLPVDFHTLGVDMLSVGGHKVGAPVGTGALLVRRGCPIVSDRPGGGHERGLRSGTPDVAGAVALATALDLAAHERERTVAHARHLRDHLLAGLTRVCGGVVRPSISPKASSPAIIHLSLPTRHPEALLMALDTADVHVSAGSACHAGVTRPSQVMLRAGRSRAEALGVLRVSTGKGTTTGDIDAFLSALPGALEAARALDALDRPTGSGLTRKGGES
ncbi:cysteine desulfurase [Schaalia sp. 19OD2882]|uniref:cysteine desulfurase family protein n=1 Tax=Schaalia sp. 19OD2882 TaxID=2794089 RepID=UPI001C1EFD45|nr:cysteine desulfurase family protein [Schaalia sp. 19OD2882]QWW20378.1 cysteine desulfurase [Schaalia sp. 19OD2882]